MKASFDSRCPECGEDIYEGDEITRNSFDEWVCASCAPTQTKDPFKTHKRGR